MNFAGKQIAIRADASISIGSGHIMRCLTLADALATAGASCRFIMRGHDGHLAGLVRSRGHAVALLPPGDGRSSDNLTHASWLGTTWETDANQTREILAGPPVDLLVIDHYALDRRWQASLRDRAKRRMALDDLADRPHDVDLLVDQNLGARVADYAALLPPEAVRLLGPRYALLRPEFLVSRRQKRATSVEGRLRSVLIAMGGTDADNISERLLDRLCAAVLPSDTTVTVVLGGNAPHIASLRARAAKMPYPTQVFSGVEDMSRVMAGADLCVGAAGGMAWERCCVGLPTLIIVLAANQANAAHNLSRAGAGLLVGEIGSGWEARFDAQLLRAVSEPQLRDTMRRRSMRICDGCGVERIIEALNKIMES